MNETAFLWLRILSSITAGVLRERGETESADLLTGIGKAYTAGRNVDDILQAAADRWEVEGKPPPREEIDETTRLISARMD